tara:strand:+ start:13216 stop:13386 length:171 start_codon:yes stop_codon:yes gene_type:complete
MPFPENVFLPPDEVFDYNLAHLVLLFILHPCLTSVPSVGDFIDFSQWIPSLFLDRS